MDVCLLILWMWWSQKTQKWAESSLIAKIVEQWVISCLFLIIEKSVWSDCVFNSLFVAVIVTMRRQHRRYTLKEVRKEQIEPFQTFWIINKEQIQNFGMDLECLTDFNTEQFISVFAPNFAMPQNGPKTNKTQKRNFFLCFARFRQRKSQNFWFALNETFCGKGLKSQKMKVLGNLEWSETTKQIAFCLRIAKLRNGEWEKNNAKWDKNEFRRNWNDERMSKNEI